MTEPQFGGIEGGMPPRNPQPGQYPPPGQFASPGPGHYPPPGQYLPPGQYPPSGSYPDPGAPYGRHPVTGEPLSDKSKVVAGLLQLLGLIGIVGVGRIYLGQTKLGVIQLIVGLVTCGLGAVIWGIVDAVQILSGNVRDPAGRPLRD